MTERAWIILAGLLVVLAAVFLWRNNLSIAFVIATLGVVAWFLSYRSQLHARMSTDRQEPPPTENQNEN
jgi:phosphate regulon sensor protein PhoR